MAERAAREEIAALDDILATLGCLAVVALGIIAAANAQDQAFQLHGLIFAVAGLLALGTVLHAAIVADPDLRAQSRARYNDGVIRAGVIATVFWGIVGFLIGVILAWQLAFPELNFDLPWTNFGRLRPAHTSAVIFAFGGNALIATSFYVVQRTCRARMPGPWAPWFVFWGYQLFLVLAASGYLLGVTAGKEYAEPEWYIDLWLTIVWVAYLLVFLGTIWKRTEPHIYVANWFYLSFIVTVAMLHIVNNLAMPVSWFGSKSYGLYSGVQDAMTQWWYGHNAVGFFLTTGFLAMMYYFIPKRVERPIYSYRSSVPMGFKADRT